MPFAPLNPGEQLLLLRRRLGLSQPAMADRVGVGLRAYLRLEKEPSENRLTAKGLAKARLKPLGKLTLGERCFLARRRAGVQRQRLAKRLGCSRLWVTMMESDRAPEAAVRMLAEHWKVL